MPDRPDLWATRDLPVLQEATWRIDQGQRASVEALTEDTGLPVDEVILSLKALERRRLIETDRRLSGIGGVSSVSGEAYQLAGLHPTPDSVTDRLIAELDKRIAATSEPENKSKLVRIRDAVIGAGRDLTVDVIGSVISKQVGGA